MLSDPEKRQKYDALGQDYQRWQQTGGASGFDFNQWAAGAGRAARGSTYGDVNDLFGDDPQFSDFFGTIFGSMAGRGLLGRADGPNSRSAAPRGARSRGDPG